MHIMEQTICEGEGWTCRRVDSQVHEFDILDAAAIQTALRISFKVWRASTINAKH